MAVGTVGRFGVEGPLTSTPPSRKATSRRDGCGDRLKFNQVKLDCLNASHCSRVPSVEVRYKFWCVQIVPRFPGVVLGAEVFPFYQVP